MLNKNALIAVTLLNALLTTPSTFAKDNYSDRNDKTTCQKRIKTIGDDINLWISKGRAKVLKLPTNITPSMYGNKMLEEIEKTEINCVKKTIYVNNIEKTCTNYQNTSGKKVLTCNFARFNAMNETDQYRLIHHEYAGLAGFEANKDNRSVYPISDQVSGLFENILIKRLATKKITDVNPDRANNGFDIDLGQYFAPHPAKYTCFRRGGFYLSERNPWYDGIILRCILPTSSDITRLKAEFLAGVNEREKAFKQVLEKYQDFQNQLYDIAAEGGINTIYGQFYFRLSKEVGFILRHEMRQLMSDYKRKQKGDFHDAIKLIGNNSPYLKQLDKINEIISSGNNVEEKYYRFISDYYGEIVKISRQMKNITKFINERLSSDNLPQPNLEFESLLNFSDSCKDVRRDRVFRVTEDSRHGLHAIKDADIIKNIFVGKSNGKKLKIACTKASVSVRDDLIPEYDVENHRLTIPYIVYRSHCEYLFYNSGEFCPGTDTLPPRNTTVLKFIKKELSL